MSSQPPQPTLLCPQCNASSSASKRFCSDCGAPLNVSDHREAIRYEIAGYLREHTKDAHVIEIELCEAVATRLQKWAKLFGWLVAFPITLVLVGLTIFGIQKVSDIRALGSRVDNEVRPQAEAALRDAKDASSQAAKAKAAAERVTIDVNRQLASASGVTESVHKLSNKVSGLEQQSTATVESATRRIQAQIAGLDQRVDTANAQINDQQKKLTDTGELVKALFSNSRLEIFDAAHQNDRLFIREAKNRRVVYMLLTGAPIPQSLQVQFHIFSEPRNSYFTFNNLVVFFWGDSLDTLKQHPLMLNYVADPTAKDKPLSKLLLKDGHVFADSVQLPDFE